MGLADERRNALGPRISLKFSSSDRTRSKMSTILGKMAGILHSLPLYQTTEAVNLEVHIALKNS